MSPDELVQWISATAFTAGLNQEYHQYLASRWAFWDGFMQFIVGVLSVVSLIAMGVKKWDRAAFWVSGAAAVMAVLMNVLPFGNWSKHHNELFQQWTAVRNDIDNLEVVVQRQLSNKAIDYLAERQQEIISQKNRIEADEPAPSRDLLEWCYGNQVERLYGPGIRTLDEARAISQAAQPKGNGTAMP